MSYCVHRYCTGFFYRSGEALRGDIDTQLLTGKSRRYVAITTFSAQEAYRQENGYNVLNFDYNNVVNIC